MVAPIRRVRTRKEILPSHLVRSRSPPKAQHRTECICHTIILHSLDLPVFVGLALHHLVNPSTIAWRATLAGDRC